MPSRFKSPSKLIIFLCSTLLLLLPGHVLGQNAPGPVSNPQALNLASQALRAIAGGTALADITIQANATYIAGSDEETGSATLIARGNAQSLITLNLSGGQRQEIRNGVQGAWVGPDGTPHAAGTHNCWIDADWFFPPLTLQALQTDPTLIVVYLGPANWNGVAALHLQFSHFIPGQTAAMTAQIRALSTMDLYLDAASLLPWALDFNTHPDDNASLSLPVEIRFGNYQKAGGVLAPFHSQKFLQGVLTTDLTVASATVNSGVSAAMFTLPVLPTGGAQ
jgi:hypothetical protein